MFSEVIYNITLGPSNYLKVESAEVLSRVRFLKPYVTVVTGAPPSDFPGGIWSGLLASFLRDLFLTQDGTHSILGVHATA